MQDLLYVSFDKDEKKNECGICIGRQNKDGSHTILKMELDEQAEILYKLLTEQGTKAAIVKRMQVMDATNLCDTKPFGDSRFGG